MRYEVMLAMRYLLTGRRQRFTSVITILSVAGVALGVAALIIVISVMNGFGEELKDKIIGANAHIIVEQNGGITDIKALLGRLKRFPHVEAAAPFLSGQALMRYGQTAIAVGVRGVDPAYEAEVTNLKRYIKEGDLDIKKGQVIVGSALAERLGLDIGSALTFISPASGRSYELKVSGVFSSGMYEYDLTLVFMSLDMAQLFYEVPQAVGAVALRLDDAYKAQEVRNDIQKQLGNSYCTMTWMDLNKNLFSALKLEKTVMFIIVALTTLVAAFGIATTLIMMVTEKIKDIGILKSIGVNKKGIALIFILQGIAIGGSGITIGLMSGLTFARFINQIATFVENLTGFEVFPKEIYYFDKIPTSINGQDMTWIIGTVAAVALISSIYPALTAARLQPVDALRYE